MDFTLVSLFKFSCAFEFLPHFGYVSVDELGDDTSPFSGIVISLGYLIVLVVTIPLLVIVPLQLRDVQTLRPPRCHHWYRKPR